MKGYWCTAALSVVALAAIDTAYAGSKHRRYVPGHARHALASVAPSSSFGPARMYEARPGVWISTYDCITDEGNGRWRPCSAGGGRGGGR